MQASGISRPCPAGRVGLPVRLASAPRSARRPSVSCSATHRVTVLPGDGIGPEITRATLKVLKAAGAKEGAEFQFKEALIGGSAYDATGDPYPAETEAACKDSEAVLLACIGGYKWDALPTADRPESGLLRLRASLGAFANLRPAIVLPQLADASTLKREVVSGVDILIVRELVGGIYFGAPSGREVRDGVKVGFSTDIYSEPEVERIARVAFEAARGRTGRLVSVDKANVLEVSRLWREVVSRIGAEEFADVELSHMYVDNAAMQLVRAPRSFDTMLTSNLFGDILSDEASMLTGSLGMLPSASVALDGPGVFEPVHGSAPDIAGADVANPLAMILSAAMLARHGLKNEALAARIERAVSAALDDGLRTADIAQDNTRTLGTVEMGDAVLQRL